MQEAVAHAPRARSPAHARHVAIIMDGNGRWAKRRGLPRTLGHRAGVQALKRTVEARAELGLGVADRVRLLHRELARLRRRSLRADGLLKAYRREATWTRLEREGVRVRIIGRRDGPVARHPRGHRAGRERAPAHNTAFNLQVAFNYGGAGRHRRRRPPLRRRRGAPARPPPTASMRRRSSALPLHRGRPAAWT